MPTGSPSWVRDSGRFQEGGMVVQEGQGARTLELGLGKEVLLWNRLVTR